MREPASETEPGTHLRLASTTRPRSEPTPLRRALLSFQRPRQWSPYPPLVILLVAGFALRLITMLLYFPTALQWIDAVRFSRLGPWHAFFGDYYMPAGYAAFLKVTHAITSNVAFTTGLQHCMGLLLGVLVYYAVRRCGGPRWLGLIPAALALLGGDQLYLEHLLMNDFLFSFLIAAGLCLGVYALVPKPRLRWLMAAGVVLALCGLVRQTGLGLPLVVAFCAFLVGADSVWQRAGRAMAVILPAVVVVAAYVGVVDISGGKYTGLTDMGGWNLYARVAPFADCHSFTPPKGTSILCESTPPQQRNGPFFYAWSPQSQGQRLLGRATPRNEAIPQKFAEAAIENEPGQYAMAVIKDVLRYADPYLGDVKGWSGDVPQTVSFEQGLVDPATAKALVQVMGRYWSDLTPHLHHVQALAWYESLTTVDGFLWIALVLLAILGMAAARGSARLGAALFGLSALVVYVLPAMTLSWDWRYGIPAQAELAAAAACGGWGLWARFGRRQMADTTASATT